MIRALTIGTFFHDLVRVVWPCFPSYSDEFCAGCRSGDTGFVKCATAPSPDSSVYCLSGNDAETLSTDTEDRGDDQAMTAVAEPLQCLYTKCLPDHLQLNSQNKHKNRPAVYTKESSTIAWQRDKAQRKVAKGCMTLDTFIQRKVSSAELNEV